MRPAVDASVYSRKGRLKSGKAVMGLVVRSLEAVEGVLTVRAPMEDRVLPGQGMQWYGDGCEVFYVAPVVLGRPKKEWTSMVFLGGLISLVPASREGSGRRPSSVTWWPR